MYRNIFSKILFVANLSFSRDSGDNPLEPRVQKIKSVNLSLNWLLMEFVKKVICLNAHCNVLLGIYGLMRSAFTFYDD